MNQKICNIPYRHDSAKNPCKVCFPETKEQRAARKAQYISMVLSKNHGADEQILIEEASKKWEEANKE